MARCATCGKSNTTLCVRCGAASCRYHLSHLPGVTGMYCTKCTNEIMDKARAIDHSL